MTDRIEPLHVILGGVPCEPDGPVRDEDDNTPKWHDIYTEGELVKALGLHAAHADHRGRYHVGTELRYAAEVLRIYADRFHPESSAHSEPKR